MSFENSLKNYTLAESMFDEMQERFKAIEEKTSDKPIFVVDRLFDDIKKLTSMLNKINVDELTEKIEKNDIENIEYNINFIYESIDYMEKYLWGEKYRDDLLIPVKKYFKKLGLNPTIYGKWAKTEQELAIKYIAAITHPNNVLTYKNQIKRIALGTMSLNEFKKIFEVTKSKMIPLHKNRFESFKNYKNE